MKIINNEINRRDFIKISTKGALAAGMVTSMINTNVLFGTEIYSENDIKIFQKSIKKDLFNYACSGALFLYLNRNFGYPKENEASAVASLSGGLMQKGYQCGMLWGSTLAAVAESYRRYNDRGEAIFKAIIATQQIIKSFYKRKKCVNCRDITGVEWSNKYGVTKYIITGRIFTCLNLAKKWAPEALKSANKGLSQTQTDFSKIPISCASEVAEKLGASEEKIVMVAGLAGGMGLSGNACGALAAAVWIRSLDWCKKFPESKDMYNPYANDILKKFSDSTNSEILCHKICGKRFNTIEEHTEFIKQGGCSKLIELLAKS